MYVTETGIITKISLLEMKIFTKGKYNSTKLADEYKNIDNLKRTFLCIFLSSQNSKYINIQLH